jgi:RNA recognition motif-containing protein
MMPGLTEEESKKRKLEDVAEIEIDVSAPEPPSKKALRNAKRKGIEPASTTSNVQPESTETKNQLTKQRSEFGVWIGNLPFATTKDDLRKFFTSNTTFTETTISRIHLPMGAPKQNGMAQNKGFAYVDFSTKKAMDEAIALSEQLILGRRVLIKGSRNFEGRPDEHQQSGSSKGNIKSSHPPSKRIFVGNLGFDATKEAVEEHFSPCGTTTNVHLATFEDSGKCKGYGWVEFDTVEAAEHAVKGFIHIPEDDENEEEEEEDVEEANSESESEDKNRRRKTKKPRTKRVWVNRLLGRQLRMEFAEDAVTRYKKRFGKEGKERGKFPDRDDEAIVEDTVEGSQQGRAPKERRPRKDNQDRQPSRYSKDTVQRLTGAIVEAQGKKVTFD